MTLNPFDAATLSKLDEAEHILNWYAQLSSSLRDRVVADIVNKRAVWIMTEQALDHVHHTALSPFDEKVLIDLQDRLSKHTSSI